MATLYRDYRPKNFAEVLGQNHIKITLQNEIKADKIAQALLFCGPRAVGKTTLARVVAKSVNCLKRQPGEFEPCNECDNCLNINLGKNLDVVEIDAASNTGVDNVRENIINFSRLSPSNSRYKVFIIDEVHMLSLPAFNALLKIIEEPPAYVIFILCTTEIQKVPSTIISRCERFDFKRISIAEVVKKLQFITTTEQVAVDQEVLETIARKSSGHLRDAESLLGQVLALGDKKISLEQAELIIPHHNNHEALELLDLLAKKNADQAIALINRLVDAGVNLSVFNNELIYLLRKIMLDKVSPGLANKLGLDLGESLEIKISALVDQLSWEKIVQYLESFLTVLERPNTAIPQLPFELAIINLSQDLASSKELDLSRPRATEQIVSKEPSQLTATKEPVNKREELSSASQKQSLAKVDSLSQAKVSDKWPEVLVKIKKHNHSLSFILQNCSPGAVKDGCLDLTFKYKFHYDRINDPAIREMVLATLKEVFAGQLDFKPAVNENLELANNKSVTEEKIEVSEEEPVADSPVTDSLVNNILKTFGGEVAS
ncbi:MAG: DNA polymerase III subunit gamma/tau [Patescibacteria group bacterium]|jgi:DNA polymerase-3 subunit gamma/tau